MQDLGCQVAARRIADGRWEVEYGPTHVRVMARRRGVADDLAARAAVDRACQALDDLGPLRAVASRFIGLLPADDPAWPAVLRLMVTAAKVAGDPTTTPMVAVAGSIAQLALAGALEAGAGTVTVENGGDVALSVEDGDSVRVGIARSVSDRRPGHVVSLSAQDGIGGVCTSGVGGRSLTRGVAETAVTFATSASLADVCATLVANATWIDDPAVIRRPAVEIDPATDIPDLTVTVRVGNLDPRAVYRSLVGARKCAKGLLERGILMGAIIGVQGRFAMLPEWLAERALPVA
jgi:ApbE superfamily uncharacterized protein (UPF0280 family)